MTVFRFKYWYCKSRMVAFINGELPPQSHQRVARFIDECPDCYTEYVRQRELRRNLLDQLQRFGQTSHSHLDRIWAAIQSDLSPAKPQARSSKDFHVRYGFVTLLLVLALTLPFLLTERHVTLSTVTQPTPRSVVYAGVTRAAAGSESPVGVATQQPGKNTFNLTISSVKIVPEAARTPVSNE